MGQNEKITPETLAAIREYARINGRTWKSKLRDEWMRAVTIGPLQALRNSHGPTWLLRFSLKDGK